MKKGITALEKWLKEEGFSCKVDYTHEEFGYDWAEDILYVGAPIGPEVGGWFAQFLYEYGCDVRNIDREVLPLLHELGHSMTNELFTEEELKHWYYIKLFSYEDSYEYAFEYWSYDDEFSANLWVMKFIEERPDSVAALAEALKESVSR